MTIDSSQTDHAAILAGIPQPYLVLNADLTQRLMTTAIRSGLPASVVEPI